ncbi:hypothetical protein MKQ70_07620 [Chitinophaga sedimenti]|uniref:hypothetical protein n=1 Tax=Chitinophaga sedimenti TaxID=2033606 RepID=UPI0020056260|nr:hypothetical protein [Chitinophaga sedimenti]MCK7554879.1 hypothetical protein [Chitinophaga sedimenti]
MKKIFIAAALLASLAGCRKSELELQNPSVYDFETYFRSSEALNQATVATYATLMHQGLWAREYYFIF